MREHLLDTFNGTRNDDYTYEELLTLRAHGRVVPDSWIVNTKRAEDEAAAEAQRAAEIADAEKNAREAVQKAKAKQIKAITPQVQEHLESLEAAKSDAATKAAAAREALKEYLHAYNTANLHYVHIRDLVNTLPDMLLDNDGNLQAGQTGYDRLRGAYFEGELVPGVFPEKFKLAADFLPPRFG